MNTLDGAQAAPRIINPRLTLEWLLSLYTGRGVEVAVIDSGVDPSHPALFNKIRRALLAVSTSRGEVAMVEAAVEEAKDECGHGSAAAGLIVGIAPAAMITSIKVLDDRLTCSSQALKAALSWTLANGIRLIYLGVSTPSEAEATWIKSLCEQAYRHGVIVVAPLENSGRPSFPAAFPSVVGVSCGTFDNVYDIKYQKGATVEYAAHGMKVRAPSAAGNYVNVSGTSFASANVAGLIALLLEAFPDISVFEVKAMLKSFSKSAVN